MILYKDFDVFFVMFSDPFAVKGFEDIVNLVIYQYMNLIPDDNGKVRAIPFEILRGGNGKFRGVDDQVTPFFMSSFADPPHIFFFPLCPPSGSQME